MSTCVSIALVAGCQANAELDLYFPRTERIVPVALRHGAPTQLELCILDHTGRPVTDSQRVKSGPGGEVVWMRSVTSDSFRLKELKVQGASASPSLGGLAFSPPAQHGQQQGVHLTVVLDNSAFASLADPGDQRITAAQALVDRVLCSQGSCEDQAAHTISIISLAGGGARTVVQASGDRAALQAALAGLGAGAGGQALLWDGLDRARQLASEAVIAIWISSADGGSQLGAADLVAAWGEAPLMVVVPGQAQDGALDGLLDLAATSRGAVIRAARLQDGVLAAGGVATAGRWTLGLSALSGVPAVVKPGALEAKGTLRMELGRASFSGDFSLPLLPRY